MSGKDVSAQGVRFFWGESVIRQTCSCARQRPQYSSTAISPNQRHTYVIFLV